MKYAWGIDANNWNRKKYCSERCRVVAAPPPTYFGEDNPNFKGEEARRKHRHGPHRNWREGVLSRDNATCQDCGTKDGELHVHHILPWEDYPDQRFDIENGITLCQLCHYKVHGYDLNQTGIVETTDESGTLTRRWVGKCLYCGTIKVKRASDMKRPDGSLVPYGRTMLYFILCTSMRIAPRAIAGS